MSDQRQDRRTRRRPTHCANLTRSQIEFLHPIQVFLRQFPALSRIERNNMAMFALRHRHRIGRSLEETRIQSAVHLVFYYLVARYPHLNLLEMHRISTFIILHWLNVAAAAFVDTFLPGLFYAYMSEPSSSGGSAAELVDNEPSDDEHQPSQPPTNEQIDESD